MIKNNLHVIESLPTSSIAIVVQLFTLAGSQTIQGSLQTQVVQNSEKRLCFLDIHFIQMYHVYLSYHIIKQLPFGYLT
jgi:hypothetical protein